MDVTTEVGDLTKTYEKTTVSGEDISVDYAVLTWTGLVSDLTWTVSAKTRNIGYINVILEDAPEVPTVDKLYVMGNGTAGEWNTTTEMTFNETTQAFEYDITAAGDTYFTFGDAEFTDWDDWNANHRYAIAAGDQEAVTGTEYELVKIEGTIKITATGTLHISVTKDLKMTLSLSTITDGIASIKAAQLEGAAVYTLQGVRVNNVKKGSMYSVNGRKCAIK